MRPEALDPTSAGPVSGEELLAAELAEDYLARLHSGERVSRDELLESHPEIAHLLERRLRLAEMLHEAGATPEPTVRSGGAGEGRAPGRRAASGGEGPGARIGPYRLLRELGAGGMGVVFHAERLEPVQRDVALKLLREGVASREAVARFEVERQALALMDHPNIAQLHGAGVTGKGRPYFAMELVRGLPLTDYCERRKLGLRERVELVATACEAIQHAHQKGVIHRDVKPSNLLVTEQDGKPVLKVIDFGVAKATGRRLTERTLATELGTILGTPEYLSPEQAELTGLDVDVRADVYSLGVVLYQLVSGELPFRLDREKGDEGLLELCRRVAEEEPEPPSKKATDRKRARLLRRELDWVTLRALEKDPNRRYQSAWELGQELRRWLAGQPTEAGPEAAGARFVRALRRRRLELATVAAVLLVLAGGLAVTSGLLARAQEARAERTDELAAVDELLARSTAQRLLAESSTLLEEDPARALALAAEAERWQPGAEANNAIVAALDLAPRDATETVVETEFGETAIWTKDGTLVVVSATDAEPSVRDPRTGEELVRLSGHPGAVGWVDVSPDGTLLLTGGRTPRGQRVVRLWELASGRSLGLLAAWHDEATMLTVGTPVAWSPDGRRLALAIGGMGPVPGRFEIWQVRPLATCHQVHGLGMAMAIAFSPDSRRLAVVDEQQVWLADVDDGRVIAQLRAPDDSRPHLSRFSPDGGVLLTGHWDGMARLWDGVTGELLQVLPGHEPVVARAKFSETGTLVATADRTSAQVWDVESGHLVRSIEVVDAHDDGTARVGSTGALALDSAGERLVTVHELGGRRSLSIWDVGTGERLHELRGVTGQYVSDLRFSANGRSVEIRTGGDRAVHRTWEPGTWRERTSLPNASGVATMGFSPDGRFVHAVDMMMSAPALVRLWDAASRRGERVLVPEPWPGSGTGMVLSWDSCWSSDGELLAVVYSDRVDVWRLTSGEQVSKLFFHDHHPQGPENPYFWLAMDVEFSPDGRSLAMATTANTVIVWDVASSEPRLILNGDERSTSDMSRGLMIGGMNAAYSPSGEAIVQSSFQHGIVNGWDAETGDALFELQHEDGVWSAVWSPDGRRVATGTSEGTATVWDAKSAERIASWQVEQRATVRGFSPDGTSLLVAHAGGFSVHEVETGGLIRGISGEGRNLAKPTFSPDGRLVAAGVQQVGLRAWRTDTWEEVVTLPGEVGALDGVRWSPDSLSLAVWQPPFGIRILPVDVASVARSHPIVANRRFELGPLPESRPPAVRLAGVR